MTQSRGDDGVTLLRLHGGLTFDGVVPVVKPFEAATAAGPVVVDLSDVSIVTTPGISLLLSAHQRLGHAGGALVLAQVPESLLDLLRRCRLDRVFTIASDEQTACDVARQPAKPAVVRPKPKLRATVVKDA